MKFVEFWAELDSLLLEKNDYVTLHDNRSFEARRAIDAVRVDSDTISTPRLIKKEEFAKIWRLSLDYPKETRFHPGNYTMNTQNASYILALFNEIVK